MLEYLLLLLLGGSTALWRALQVWAWPSWVSAAAFLTLLYGIGFLAGLPFSFAGFRLEHRFGLSTQSLRSWLADGLKSLALGLVAVVVAGSVLLWLMADQPSWWWAIAWALGLLVSFVLNTVAPVVIAPLFFRFRPLQDPALRSRFEQLARKAGVPVLGVFEMAASAKTRRSNAAVTGLGRTRRIIVTDTMLRDFTPDEVDTVLAHELGHQRFRDPVRGLIVGALVSFVMLGVAAFAYAATYRGFGIPALADAAGLPLLVLWAGIVSMVLSPPELAWSRRREGRADGFSLETTRNPGAFTSAMVKLHDQNLGLSDPSRWEERLFYSHPPGRERVRRARAFRATAPTSR